MKGKRAIWQKNKKCSEKKGSEKNFKIKIQSQRETENINNT